MRPHTETQAYPQLNELDAFREEHGYDPLRWLWTSSIDGTATGDGDSTELATAYSIIAGISDRWELAGWYWAETVTRQRVHVLDRLRARDVAIVRDERRFAEIVEWELSEQERSQLDDAYHSVASMRPE